jgi:hypothetical protein
MLAAWGNAVKQPLIDLTTDWLFPIVAGIAGLAAASHFGLARGWTIAVGLLAMIGGPIIAAWLITGIGKLTRQRER